MKVAILYDAGSDEWSPQDVAAVVGNVHEVRDVLRRRGHEVELSRSVWATSAGSAASGGSTSSSISARGSTATPSTRTWSSGRSS